MLRRLTHLLIHNSLGRSDLTFTVPVLRPVVKYPAASARGTTRRRTGNDRSRRQAPERASTPARRTHGGRPDQEHSDGLPRLGRDTGRLPPPRYRRHRRLVGPRSAYPLHRAAHARLPDRAVPAGHHIPRLQRPADRGARADPVRTREGHVPPPHLRRHPRARAAGAARLLDLGAREEGSARATPARHHRESALARRLRARRRSGRLHARHSACLRRGPRSGHAAADQEGARARSSGGLSRALETRSHVAGQDEAVGHGARDSEPRGTLVRARAAPRAEAARGAPTAARLARGRPRRAIADEDGGSDMPGGPGDRHAARGQTRRVATDC